MDAEPLVDGPVQGCEKAAPLHLRHNFIALLIDYVSFGVAFSALGISTILPAFVRTLTKSEPLIGLISMVLNGGWFLPQLGGAAIMSGKPRKKPYLVAMIYLGRPLFLLLATATGLGLTRNPPAMLALLYLVLAGFTVTDSIASVAWFDILARAIPPAPRARLVGAAQLLIGILGTFVGWLIARILEAPDIPYPLNYAVIFAFVAVAFLPSTIAITLIREPPGEIAAVDRSPAGFLGQLGEVWRTDRRFRRIVRYRLLVGLMELSLPFYVVHALEAIGLPEGVQGWFVSAQTIGGVLASVGLGWLSERYGPPPIIRVGAATALLAPLFALVIHFAPSLSFLYPAIFFLLGVNSNSWMQGPINYVLEIAPGGKRPLYIGLYNTLAGTLLTAPLVGGLILRLASYPVLFGVTALGTAGAFWSSLRLERPRGQSEAMRA